MAMGREGEVQGDLMMSLAEMPRSPGHVLYDRLQKLLVDAGFDAFVEETCKKTRGALPLPLRLLGRFFQAQPGSVLQKPWTGDPGSHPC
jgi:transposase